jgi:hypothetical protein
MLELILRVTGDILELFPLGGTKGEMPRAMGTA